MLQTDSFLIGSGEVPLFVESWPGKSGKKGAVLLIVHGLGEHGGRYAHVPQFLGQDFDRFYALDQRGHGRSGGLRGYTPSFSAIVDDLTRAIHEIEEREKGKRIVLLAHSFGGLVGLSYLLQHGAGSTPLSAAVISAPLLEVALKVPSYKKALGEVLGRTLSKVQLTNEVNPSYLSHDPHVVAAYVNDRLVHGKITPRLYLEMSAAMRWVLAQQGPLACPTLFIIPGDDRIVSSPRTTEFYRALKDDNKELREYPGFYHESLNEIGKEKVFEDIHKWLATLQTTNPNTKQTT